MDISFKKIDENNLRAIIDMKQPPDQHFVAENVISLAQAYVYYEDVQPFAVYCGEKLIGFIMFDYDDEKKEAAIWRFMIAVEEQGKGYGTQTLRLAIQMLKDMKRFDAIFLDYVPENVVAEHIYKKLGFSPTGEIENGEIVMKLDIK